MTDFKPAPCSTSDAGKTFYVIDGNDILEVIHVVDAKDRVVVYSEGGQLQLYDKDNIFLTRRAALQYTIQDRHKRIMRLYKQIEELSVRLSKENDDTAV